MAKGKSISETDSSASSLISILSDDQLLEVFLRLPHRRYVIQCSSVCKRWYSLISNPKFTHQFIQFHHQKQCSDSDSSSYSLPYTILLTSVDYYCRPFGEILSKKSKILHGKQPSSTSSSSSSLLYQNIWPVNSRIRASFGDLLLISDSRHRYGICNPLTRQLFWLPDFPRLTYFYSESCGFLCELKNNNFNKQLLTNINDLYRFKVLICIHSFDDHYDHRNGVIFCSETGNWSDLILSFPPQKLDYLGDFVASNGILYTLEKELQVKGLVAIDLSIDGNPKQGRIIDLPIEFVRGCRDSGDDVWYGVVRGQLRLAQMVKSKREYDLNVWELELDCDNWVLMHTIKLKRENHETNKFVAAFHPYNGNVIFISNNHEIYKYEIEGKNYKLVGQLQGPNLPSVKHLTLINNGQRFFQAFPLVYPLWPTPIPLSPNV